MMGGIGHADDSAEDFGKITRGRASMSMTPANSLRRRILSVDFEEEYGPGEYAGEADTPIPETLK
jgi:hypothetical protein